jgi:hypothetical protein
MDLVREPRSRTWTALVGVLLLSFGLGLSGFVVPQTTSAQPVDPASFVQAFVEALDRGDIDGVMATFAPRAAIAYSGFGPCQISTVCVGVDPIRRTMQLQIDRHEVITITNLQVFGSVVVAQNERRNDFISCHGHERILATLVAEVAPTGILSVADLGDFTDQQTLENGRILSQNPLPPCGS